MRIGVLALQGAFIEHEKMFAKLGVEVLATVNGKTVAARQKNMLVTAFHPELNGDTSLHEYFLKEFVK